MIQYKSLKQAQIAIGVTLFIFAFFSTAYIQLTASILSYIVEAEGYTDPILSNMIVTISSLAQIPACLLGAFLGKRMDKKRWSYFGIGCFIIGSLLVIPFSGNLYLVLLCRLVVGFGSGILTLVYTAILPDFYAGKSLSTMLGLVTSGGGFWGFVFSNLTANLCGAYGWKQAYLLHLYAVVPLILLAVFVPKKPLISQPEGKRGPSEKKGINPKIFLYSLLGALLYMGVQVIWSNTSLWVRDTLGGTAAQIGIVSGSFSLFSCGARLLFGPVYSRLRERVLHLSVAVLVLGLFLASSANSFGMALVAGSLVGAAMGFTAPACLNLCIEAAPENQVTAQAITTIGFAMGQFVSTYWRAFVGISCDGSLPGTFRMTAYFAMVLLAVLLSSSILQRRKKSVQKTKTPPTTAG